MIYAYGDDEVTQLVEQDLLDRGYRQQGVVPVTTTPPVTTGTTTTPPVPVTTTTGSTTPPRTVVTPTEPTSPVGAAATSRLPWWIGLVAVGMIVWGVRREGREDRR